MGGGGGGGEAGGGTDGAGGSGGCGGCRYTQITKPLRVTELSLYHVNVSPAAMATLLGPLVPSYRMPPMVTWSKPLSVSNSVVLTITSAPARMVQRSLLP